MLIESSSKGQKKNALTEFMKKNKSMVFLLPILLIGIIVVLVMYSKPQNKPEPSIPSSANSQDDPQTPDGSDLKVEVLPQMERVKQPKDLNLSQVKDPFEAAEPSVFLKGVVLSDKTETAIIETESRAYVVSIGDTIEPYWQVESIEEKKVILKDRNGEDLILTLN
jgi:type II secretory pathway component PulC